MQMQLFNREKKELHVLNILDSTGHTKVEFDPTNTKDVAKVREQFNEIMASQRPLAYAVDESGETNIIQDFDPDAKETFLAQQLQGG